MKRIDYILSVLFERMGRQNSGPLPNHMSVPLEVLAKTIEPVINRTGIRREARYAVADGWEKVAELLEQNTKKIKVPFPLGHEKLIAALQGIADAIRKAPEPGVDIEVPVDVIRSLKQGKELLRTEADLLRQAPLDRQALGPKIAFLKTNPVCIDYPRLSDHGEIAATLELAYDTISHHMSGIFGTQTVADMQRAFDN